MATLAHPNIRKLPSPPYVPKAYEVEYICYLPKAGDAGRLVRVVELGNSPLMSENRREFWVVDTGVGWALVIWSPEVK